MIFNKERSYIFYRRLKAFCNSLAFYLCRVFPIDKKLVSVCTFEGKGGFGCNPKYIVQELHKRDPELRFVWFVNDMSKEFPDYIKHVSNTLWNRAYWLSRSKIWIDNYRKPYGTIKRNGQFYVNTWHGMIGFKTIGLWRGKAFSKMAYLVSKNDSNMVDYFLSDSKFCSTFFPKGLVYSGSFLESGSPRCDILIQKNDAIKRRFRIKYELPLDCKCLMFAPTFREISASGKRSIFSESFTIDFERVLKNMSSKFNSEWYLCLRLHPQLCHLKYQIPNVKFVDISSEDDMYENLAAMDAFITDYSSCAMDAELLHIPVFIYADDIGQYKTDRGDFVWEIDEKSRGYAPLNHIMLPELNAVLPFTIAHNNDELEKDILNFDREWYLQKLAEYELGVGLITDGMASTRVSEEIMKHIK